MVNSRKERPLRISMPSSAIVFQNVSNMVRDGVSVIAETAHLKSELDQPKKLITSRGSGIQAKAKLISEDTSQFKSIQESIKNKNLLTHYAIKQFIPYIIESQYQDSKIINFDQCVDNQLNKEIHQPRQEQNKEKKISHINKYHEVLLKTQKDGTCTWSNRSERNLNSNPIRRRSTTDLDNEHKLKRIISLRARGA